MQKPGTALDAINERDDLVGAAPGLKRADFPGGFAAAGDESPAYKRGPDTKPLSAVPKGLHTFFGQGIPALKGGANNRCAYGAHQRSPTLREKEMEGGPP
jgi:hypothetical protein